MAKIDKQTRKTLVSMLLGSVFIVLVFATGRGDDSELWYFLSIGFLTIGSVILAAFLFFITLIGIKRLWKFILSRCNIKL